jgi:hypothetical protein
MNRSNVHYDDGRGGGLDGWARMTQEKGERQVLRMDQYSTNVSMYETLFVDNHVGADDVRHRNAWAVE